MEEISVLLIPAIFLRNDKIRFMKHGNALSVKQEETLEEELRKAQELIASYQRIIKIIQEENNRVISDLTHNLSSPLQTASMSVEVLLERSPPEHLALLQRIESSTEKMINIIKSLRNFQVKNRQTGAFLNPE